MPVSVCIKYGFGEGDWHGKRLLRALRQTGYSVTRDAEAADVIISHSGGCFSLPANNPGQLIILIGPPYWPGKSPVFSIVQKIYRDFMDFARNKKLPRWFLKTFWNLLYGTCYMPATIMISWSARKHNFYKALRQDQIVLIRNEHDAFCTPDIEQLPVAPDRFRYFHLPGQHDDCWENPEPYVQVLQSLVSSDSNSRKEA